MKISVLRPDDYDQYEEYLRRFDESLLYYSLKYKAFLEQLICCQSEYIVAHSKGNLVGILPLMYTEHNRRKIYNSLPYYGSNGGFLSFNEEANRKLAGTYNEIAISKDTISATIICNPFLPKQSQNIKYTCKDQRTVQFTTLSNRDVETEVLMGRIDGSARRNIRKAEYCGVAVDIDYREMDRLEQMHRENMEAVGGLPKSAKFFQLIPQYFVPGQDYKLYVARADNVVIAALLVFYFHKTVEYFTPGIQLQYRSLQPLSLIILEALKDAAGSGYTRWNWGGSTESMKGVYRFKKKWSSCESLCERYTYVNDEDILTWSKEKILGNFANFFVVPFDMLKETRR